MKNDIVGGVAYHTMHCTGSAMPPNVHLKSFYVGVFTRPFSTVLAVIEDLRMRLLQGTSISGWNQGTRVLVPFGVGESCFSPEPELSSAIRRLHSERQAVKILSRKQSPFWY